jgi:hypothetical protein
MRHAIINHVYIPYMEQQQMVLLCDDADADAVNRERECVWMDGRVTWKMVSCGGGVERSENFQVCGWR